MTTILLLGFLLFAAIVYAIYRGYVVRTMLRWLGATFTFEAQKDVESSTK
jgi:hypothetical protein